MPIYRFRCPRCKREEEPLLSMGDRNKPRGCKCGGVGERLLSLPSPAIFTPTGRGIILNILNQEGGQFPGGDKHRDRYEKVMGTSLDQTRPTIGKGF